MLVGLGMLCSPVCATLTMSILSRYLPTPEALQGHRWLRWLGPALAQPHLWRISRRGLSMGMALGIFFGLLIPVAQIPVSAAAAVLLRANLPAAVGSTLVTNPVTFGPVYYGAWRLGKVMLGEEVEAGEQPPAVPTATGPGSTGGEAEPDAGWWAHTRAQLAGVGKPLVLGLGVLACGVGLLTYLLVSWGWWLRVRLQRRRRLKAAAQRAGQG